MPILSVTNYSCNEIMTKKLKHLLEGIGSVFDIYPDPNKLIQLVPKKSQNERMKQAWESTGKQIKDAAGQFSDEQKQKKHSVR